MKQWNNPELLNLMLQETKEPKFFRPSKPEEHTHTCLKESIGGKTCQSTKVDGEWRCLNDGHVETQWESNGNVAVCCTYVDNNNNGSDTPPGLS